MLTVSVLDVIGWIVTNILEILLFISIIVGGIQTWRSNRGNFWAKLKEVAIKLVNDAESMPNFKKGDGTLKRDYVVKALLEEFGSKFAFISEKKLQEIVDEIVKGLNIFSKLN